MPSEPSRRVSVIIPTWKRDDLLRKCLESLRRQTFTNFEIVIVSNGAGEWAEALAKEFGAKLVRFPKNRGFAAGVNAGIDASRLPYVAILNDDVELAPNWLHETASLLDQKPDISFCCGKIFQPDGRTIDNVGDAISMGGGAWRLGYGRPDGQQFDLPRQLIAVSMTAAIFRRSVFEKIGHLDENFISYLEDMDFSIRLWRAGFRGLYLPQATARHHGGASGSGPSSPETFRLLTRNQLLILAKHFPLATCLRFAPRILWAQLLWGSMAIRKGFFGPYFTGMFQGAFMLPRIWRTRVPLKPGDRRAFLNWLRESERAIYEDISARPSAEQDTYWRLYFAVFKPKGPPNAGITSSLEREPDEKQKADTSSLHTSG